MTTDRIRAFYDTFGEIPHQRALGFDLVEVGPDHVIGWIPFAPTLVGNPMTGVPHGGVVTTLLDTIGGAAVWAALDALVTIATLDLRIDYLRPSTPGEDIYGRASCYKLTRHVAFTRGLAYNRALDDPVAAMSATYMLHTITERRER